jgi:hypothetical protein
MFNTGLSEPTILLVFGCCADLCALSKAARYGKLHFVVGLQTVLSSAAIGHLGHMAALIGIVFLGYQALQLSLG